MQNVNKFGHGGPTQQIAHYVTKDFGVITMVPNYAFQVPQKQ